MRVRVRVRLRARVRLGELRTGGEGGGQPAVRHAAEAVLCVAVGPSGADAPVEEVIAARLCEE